MLAASWFVFATLSVGEFALFHFAMFQLTPLAGRLNKYVYRSESYLSHLVRTQRFVDELGRQEEALSGEESAPDPVEEVAFEDVWFSYN